MKSFKFKVIFYICIFVFAIFLGLVKPAKADDYTKAVIGHVVTQKVTGGNIDSSKLMEQELEKLAHKYAIDMISVLQVYLPAVLDGIAADLRMKADEKYKCELLKDTANACKWSY